MGVFTFVKAGKQLFNTIKGVEPKVNKTKLDTAKSELAKSQQKLKGSTAKLKQTQFEIKNKLPITFNRTNKKTMSNTELKDQADYLNKTGKYKVKKEKKKTKVFIAPENFNKGGRVGLKGGSFPDLSGDGEVTKEDILIGRGVIPKPKNKKKKTMMAKKSETPMDKAVKKDKKKKRFV